MRVNILEPKGIIWEGNAGQVILPAEEGQMCVLDLHQPFFVRLKKGIIQLASRKTAIKDGVAFMQGNVLSIFVEIGS